MQKLATLEVVRCSYHMFRNTPSSAPSLEEVFITPRRVCASGVKQLVVSVVRPSVRPSVMQVILKSGDSASIRTSKREDNDEIRRILAYVYLVEHKAVSFSAFSTFF